MTDAMTHHNRADGGTTIVEPATDVSTARPSSTPAPTDEPVAVGDDDPAAPPPTRPDRRGWRDGPFSDVRTFELISTVVVLALTTIVMFMVVHLNPLNPGADLIFDDNTPTGGDMGAHVWGPAFLRDHLLPNFQLSGWSMDWYAGLPVYRFYMVVPALATVALDTVLPYGIAFKIIAVIGLVAMPLCCWAFGKLAGFRSPMPQLFAVAGMAFVLQESYSIYGGNLKSTMAGEFSFSIALSLGVLGLGLLAKAMQTGRYRSWTAIVLALAIVSHGIVAIYIAVAAAVVVIVHLDNMRRVKFGIGLGVATVLLSLFWIGPFLGNHAFMTDMKYGGRPDGASDSFWDMFFPFPDPIDILVTGLAVIGFGASIARRHLTATALGVIGLFTVALVFLTRDSLPIIGLLWNPRLLPFLYLLEFLLAMVGVVEVAELVANLRADRRASTPVGIRPKIAALAVTTVLVSVGFAFFYEVLPGGEHVTRHGQSVYAWGPFHKNAHPDNDDAYQKAQGNGWSKYNFGGYEGRPYYPEYHDVVQQMATIGRTEGCGRALWENNKDNGNYGTTMALMLLPFWTDGCITSMEGLFFEASGTTPYHFLTTAAMSASSSNPVRELRYQNNDAAVGARGLQALGVRYAMVRTDEAKREAGNQGDLTLLAEVGPWEIYEVADSEVVVPLDVQPVVVAGRSGDQRERNLELGTSWFQQPDEWAAMPDDDGPDEWQRIEVEVDEERMVPDLGKCEREAAQAAAEAADEAAGADPSSGEACEPDTRGRQVDIVVPTSAIEAVDLPSVTVSDVEIGQQDLSFTVDQVGVPVLVKVSYFPNWEVEGAEGPYRIAPNFMVVVPTETDVELRYARSGSDAVFYGATLAGIGLLVFFRRRGDVDLDGLGDDRHDNDEGDDGPDDVESPDLVTAEPAFEERTFEERPFEEGTIEEGSLDERWVDEQLDDTMWRGDDVTPAHDLHGPATGGLAEPAAPAGERSDGPTGPPVP